MKSRAALSAFVFLCVAVAPCLAHHTAVIVNKGNEVENVTSAQLAKIVHRDLKKWPDGKNIILVLHKDSPGEREALERLNRMSPAEWTAFVIAHRDSILFVDTDEEVRKAVQAEPGAMGLIEVHSIDSTVNVIRVDGKLPMEYGYLPH